jgi:hypothetical protein
MEHARRKCRDYKRIEEFFNDILKTRITRELKIFKIHHSKFKIVSLTYGKKNRISKK